MKVKAKWPKGTYISLFYRKSKYDTVGNKSIYKFMNEAKAELIFFYRQQLQNMRYVIFIALWDFLFKIYEKKNENNML